MDQEFERQEQQVFEATAQYVPQPPEKPRKKGAGKVVALALVCSLVGGAVGAGCVALSGVMAEKTGTSSGLSPVFQGSRPSTVIDIHTIDTGKLMTAAEVYAANVHSTVGITTSVTTNFWGYQTTSAASGSGFVYSADGYILTNYHVVEGASAITVSMYDGSHYTADLVGFDAGNDIAVLKIEGENLTPVVLGDSKNMNVGDSVVAIGNPLGELTFSLTAGSVSAMERNITMSNGVTMNLLQTDCAINSGNSGGALFNLYGEVIGITTAKYSSNSSSGASIDNIGFAIPINNVRDIVDSIIEKGYVSKAYIGITVSDVTAEMQSYGLPKGAAVRGMEKDSPAEKAGLRTNDIITHVSGEEISGSNQLVTAVGKTAIGDTIHLTVYRQGQTLEITVTVGEQRQSALEQQGSQSRPQR